MTVPGTAHHSARTGAVRSASFTGGSVSAQSVEGTSSMPPSSPGLGSLAQQHVRVLAQRHEGEPHAHRSLGSRRLAGSVPSMPCAWALQSRCSGHIRHDGRLGVQRLAPRSISACAKSPARFAGVSVRRQAPDLLLGRGQRLLHREQPGDHPLDVAVDGRGARAEGDGRDRRRRVGADARQLQQLVFRLREAAAEALGDDPGALVEIAGAAVVAEPGPRREHVVELGRSQRLHRRPAREEALVEGDDGSDRGLLQHDLGEPDRVGVRRAPRPRAPRQVAALAVVPMQQRARPYPAQRGGIAVVFLPHQPWASRGPRGRARSSPSRII